MHVFAHSFIHSSNIYGGPTVLQALGTKSEQGTVLLGELIVIGVANA